MISLTSWSRSASLSGIFSSLITAPSSRTTWASSADADWVGLPQRGAHADDQCFLGAALQRPDGVCRRRLLRLRRAGGTRRDGAERGRVGRVVTTLLHALAELHRVTASGRCRDGRGVGGRAWGARRRTSWSIASDTGRTGVGQHERLALVERERHRRASSGWPRRR